MSSTITSGGFTTDDGGNHLAEVVDTILGWASTPAPVLVVDTIEAMSGGTYPGHRRSGARGICRQGDR
jgi:hypothetical protein